METADDKKPQGPNEIAGFVSKTYEILNVPEPPYLEYLIPQNYFLVHQRELVHHQGHQQVSGDRATQILQTSQCQQLHQAAQHVWLPQGQEIKYEECVQPSLLY